PANLYPADRREGAAVSLDESDAMRLLEALLFASPEPVSDRALAQHFPAETNLAGLLKRLQADYAGRGVNLVERDGAWAFRTAADLAGRLKIERTAVRRLSRAALETLAV